jgi:hypothetical protein
MEKEEKPMVAESESEIGFMDLDMGPDPVYDDASEDIDDTIVRSIHPPPQTLRSDQVWIQLHTNSRQLQETIQDEHSSEGSEDPLWPFQTVKDFELARLLYRKELGEVLMNDIIKYCRSIQGQDSPLTLTDVKELKHTLDKGVDEQDKVSLIPTY